MFPSFGESTVVPLWSEQKTLDTSFSGSLGSNWSAALIDPDTTQKVMTPALGDGYDEREGMSIMLQTLWIRGVVTTIGYGYDSYFDQTDTVDTEVFLAVVLDRQTNHANCDPSQIYLPTTGDHVAFPVRNPLYRERYTVLREFRVLVPAPNIDSYWNSVLETPYHCVGNRKACFEAFLHLDIPVGFNNSSLGSIHAVSDNSIHVVGVFKGGTTTTVNVGYQAQCKFVSN